jgi:ribosomal protein S18/ribosomal protein L33
MAREIITIECTEARKEAKSPSRYTTTRNKKLKTDKLEIKKYNPALRRHTVHKEIKPRKTNTEKSDRRGGKSRTTEARTPRPKPKIDFTEDALDFKNINLLRQFVTDQGRILPRKYTGLPAHYQRRMTNAIKRARQMLLMK